MFCSFTEFFKIKPCIILRSFERCDQALGCRLACAVAEGRKSRVNNVNTCKCSHEKRHIARARCVVGVEVNRNVNFSLEPFNKIVCGHRQKQVCHILDTNRVGTHLNELFRKFNEIIFVMDGTDCVAQCRFTVSAVFFCEFNCGFQITNVVECIENSNNINSVFNCLTAELFNNVIRIVLISQNVLSAEQHLKACMRECFFELSETFPRIFIQKTEAGIKSCTAPAFK